MIKSSPSAKAHSYGKYLKIEACSISKANYEAHSYGKYLLLKIPKN